MSSVQVDGDLSAGENNGCNNEAEEVDINSVLNLIISRSGVQDKIHIKDVAKVESIIEDIISAGPQELQISMQHFLPFIMRESGAQRLLQRAVGVISVAGLIQDSRITSPELKVKAQALFDKYHPIEIDTSLNAEERASKMEEWYTLKHEVYVNSGIKIKPRDIEEAVREAYIFLRDGSHKVLKKLHEANVPTLVFSAGNGNAVEEVLKINNVYFPSVKIISNFMEFDKKTGDLVSFSQPTVHPGNKSEAALHSTHSNYFETLKERRNAILLGDNVGDANMASGMPVQKAILKIGYINFDFEKHLGSFKEAFDVVLIDDQSLYFMDALLDMVLKDSS